MEFYDELYLHDLVHLCGLDLPRVRAVRNQVRDKNTGETSWDLWQRDRAAFNRHQGLCNQQRFRDATHVVSFVETADHEALFLGVQRVVGYHLCPKDVHDPLTGEHKPHLYKFEATQWLNSYVARMVVNWEKMRSWVRRLPGSGKPISITEIRPGDWYRPFPGYVAFQASLREVEGFSPAWARQLSTCRGVYLLVHPDSGEQYVGSATGEDGFLGRWHSYAADGHGGNKLLRPLTTDGIPDYHISILEVAGSTMQDGDVLEREAAWKDKLGTRAHGLNAN